MGKGWDQGVEADTTLDSLTKRTRPPTHQATDPTAYLQLLNSHLAGCILSRPRSRRRPCQALHLRAVRLHLCVYMQRQVVKLVQAMRVDPLLTAMGCTPPATREPSAVPPAPIRAAAAGRAAPEDESARGAFRL